MLCSVRIENADFVFCVLRQFVQLEEKRDGSWRAEPAKINKFKKCSTISHVLHKPKIGHTNAFGHNKRKDVLDTVDIELVNLIG